MLLDSRYVEQVPDSIDGDCVIVGAGTVGILLAVSLARHGVRVVLLESGGRVVEGIHGSKAAISLGKHHRSMNTGRAVGIGGTSVLWGGQLAEFDEIDLNRQGLEWPIGYAELGQWYEHVYRITGTGISRPVDEYRKMFGDEADLYLGVERIFTRWAPQPNFAKLFQRELGSGTAIRVVMHATACRVDFEGPRAEAIWANTADGRRIRVSGRNFVLAAGTIANTRFLLSTQRLGNVPWEANKCIGRRFQDHLGGKIADVQIDNEERFRTFFENGLVDSIKLQPKLRLASEARARVDSGVSGLFVFQSSISEHLGNVKAFARAIRSGTAFSRLAALPRDLLAINRAFAPLVIRYLRDRRVFAFYDRGVELHVQAEQIPVAASEIRIVDDALGSDGLFRVGVNWQIDGREALSIRTFFGEADRYLRKQGIAHLRPDPVLEEGDTALLESFSDTAHQCGGTAMSSSPSSGVTDHNCKLWGTDNIFIGGASVFPTSSHANCTLTALALATRLASRLSAQALSDV